MSASNRSNFLDPFAVGSNFMRQSGSAPARAGLDACASACARANLEMTSLAGNRARAIVELQGSLLRCRTPGEVMGLQLGFWQSASNDYLDACRRIGEAWTAMLRLPPAPFQDAGAVASREASEPSRSAAEIRRPTLEDAREPAARRAA